MFCRTKFNWHDKSQQDSSVICASNIGFPTGEAIHNQFKKKLLGLTSYKFAQVLDDLGLNMNDFFRALLRSTASPASSTRRSISKARSRAATGCIKHTCSAYSRDENTGWPWAEFGTEEFLSKMLLDVAYRRGFGDILANGFRYATQYIYEHEEFGENRAEIMFIYQRIYGKAGKHGLSGNGHGQYVPNPAARYTRRLATVPARSRSSCGPRCLPSTPAQCRRSREKWLGEGNKILICTIGARR